MLSRGRLVFRLYIKNKRDKYGIKFFELCKKDGKNRYLLSPKISKPKVPWVNRSFGPSINEGFS